METLEPEPEPPQFNDGMFNRMFVKEKKLAFKIPDDDDLTDEKLNERDKISALIKKAQDKMLQFQPISSEEFKSYSESLNKFTDADVYRYALNRYRKYNDVFECGIERTETLFYSSRTQPKPFSGNSKVDYIKNFLFPEFYKYLQKYDDEIIYRFFIRLLCLCDGFAVINDILIRRFNDDIGLNPQTSSPPSPEEPGSHVSSQPQQFRNQNIIQVSDSQPVISLTSILFYRFNNRKTLNDSDPFKVVLEYDLVKMLNRPFNMLFSTLFEMNDYFKSGNKITPNIFITTQNEKIKRANESLLTTMFKGYQYIGGRKISKKKHRKSKHKKSNKSKKSKSRRVNKNKK
jgi:hypothetical protein